MLRAVAPAPGGPAGPPPAPTLPEVYGPGLIVDSAVATIDRTTFQTIAEHGVYTISLYLVVSYAVSGATGDITITLYWTDPSNQERAVTSAPVSIPSTGYTQMTICAWIASGTNLDYSVRLFNMAAGSRAYSVRGIVERLS